MARAKKKNNIQQDTPPVDDIPKESYDIIEESAPKEEIKVEEVKEIKPIFKVNKCEDKKDFAFFLRKETVENKLKNISHITYNNNIYYYIDENNFCRINIKTIPALDFIMADDDKIYALRSYITDLFSMR